jgi:hypothetical protein
MDSVALVAHGQGAVGGGADAIAAHRLKIRARSSKPPALLPEITL